MIRLAVSSLANPPRISRHLYGHFAEHLGRCVYEGLWVGEESPIPNLRGIRQDGVAALRQLQIPNLRWPGGCFADEYHWEDGIGPRARRPASINSHWGGVEESNAFGTHEFLDLCEQLGAAPYICGNVGSGTVREMQQWLEYLTAADRSAMPDRRRRNGREAPWSIPFWGVGNENWGCGGNMSAEQYAAEFRRYATYCRNIDGNNLYRIACGPNTDDYHWTEVLMKEGRPGFLLNGLSLHYYVVPGGWANKNSATVFDESDWLETLALAQRMDELVTKHSAIMDQYDPGRVVGLVVDEWGTWFANEPGTNPGFLYQQNTVRDALVAGLTLNIFHRHAARVKMANIAQVANVLQSPILTDGPRMLITPTYHVFEMYKVHQDATLLDLQMDAPLLTHGKWQVPAVSSSASVAADGTRHVSLCNLDPKTGQTVELTCEGWKGSATARVLAGDSMTAHNSFDKPGQVLPRPLAVVSHSGRLTVELPPASVALLTLSS